MTWLNALLAKLFGKTVDSIVADIDGKITQLGVLSSNDRRFTEKLMEERRLKSRRK